MVNTSLPIEEYRQAFPGNGPTHLVRSPGRVNLIGEHVDYCDGFVLPVAMSQALWVAAGPRDDGQIAVRSTAFPETIQFPAANPGPPAAPQWSNYVRGVAEMLRRRGLRLKAGNLLIHSEVPIGGGVSSSAALEIGTALALLSLTGDSIDRVPLALLARQAEHEYAQSPCGIMDQFICALGRRDHALLLDCRSQEYDQIPLPLTEAGAVLVIMNTQVKHDIGSSEYPVRQRQCRAGLDALRKRHANVKSLRDVTSMMLKEAQLDMDELTFDRCWHVVTEIERTVKAAEALRAGDLVEFGKLMVGSHQSLSVKYAVSCPELDAIVEVARHVEGVFGARMTGGGFGGCAIALARKEGEPRLREAIQRQYDGKFEKPALVYTTMPDNGAEANRV